MRAPSPTFLDRMVSWASPGRGLNRLRARMALGALGWGGGAYKGASVSRRQTKGWSVSDGDADTDLIPDLATLRERSRSLVRDNPLARGALNTVVTSVVGTGLSLQSAPDAALIQERLGWTPERIQAWQRQAERLFRFWAEGTGCDIARTNTFYEIQELVFRTTLESGDCLVLLAREKDQGSPFSLRLQVVEGDRLGNQNGAPDTATLRGGVELNGQGAPVAYHILTRHPGTRRGERAQRSWAVRPALNRRGRRAVLHIFRRLRPDQHRGEPYLAPVIEAFRELGEYTDGELRAAVISGLYTVFIKSAPAGFDPPAEGDAPPAKDLKLDYGAINFLESGEEIAATTPGRPNQAFDPFVMAVLRQIGVALEIPFELLVKHFTASYSAARAAILEAWRFFKGRREWLAAQLCRPVYEAVIEEAVALGLLEAPGFDTDPMLRWAFCQSDWTGDAPGQLDPLKEVAAAEKRLALRLTTRAEETASLTGRDWDQVVERAAQEERRMGALGLSAAIAAADLPQAEEDE